MPHFFISYAKKDTRQLALQLEAALKVLPDVTAWVDKSLKAGQSWELQIQKEIDRCDFMVVLYSPDINRHKKGEEESYMLSEIHYAKRIARKPIIPVMAQITEPPMSLTMEQYIDFTIDGLLLDDLITAICDEAGIKIVVSQTVVSAPPRIEIPSAPPKPTEPALGTRMTDHKGIEMVYVPAGKFMMGSNENDNEKPIHEVQITQLFWLDLTPVTNDSFARFVADGGYKNSQWWTKAGWEWLQSENVTAPTNYEGFNDPQQPRVGVSWYESYAYARWRGGRLPTEAEWEWAARGSENRIYPWGNTFEASRIIYKDNSNGKSAIVGSGIRLSGASWVGALDMSGNVWEWCSSLYKAYPYQADDGRENKYRDRGHVLRGGSWNTYQGFARSAYRSLILPSYRSNNDGFRVVRPPLYPVGAVLRQQYAASAPPK